MFIYIKKVLPMLLSVLLIFCTTYYMVGAIDIDLDMGGFMGDDSNEMTTVFIEENENGVKGGYLTKNKESYTAVPYKNATFVGWFDKSDVLISTFSTITPEKSDEYYIAKFNTENLINDSGFESYGVDAKIYDAANSSKQSWTVHHGTKVIPVTANWGSMYARDLYKKSGNVSFEINPPWQLISTNVNLAANTEYYIGFDWLYTTKFEDTYITIDYGFYVPDSSNINMVALNNNAIFKLNAKGIAQATWNKTGFLFTTGDTIPDNAKFGFVLRAYNDRKETDGISDDDINTTTLFLDDIMVTPAEKFEITLNATNVATIEPVNGSAKGYVIKGEEYFFNVITEPNVTPEVSIGDTVLTADEDGVYSFLATGDSEIKIDCGAADEGRPAHGKDYRGRDLTKYNRDVYLENIWEGDTVYHETALFLTGKDTVKLLYPVDEVVSLRSYSLDTTYIKGVDFEITKDGLIKRLEGSRIPVYSGALTTNVDPIEARFPLRDDANTWLVSIKDATHAKTAVAVTYKHSKTFNNGYQPIAPESQKDSLNNTLAKLENGEKVNIVIYGDSISCGWSSSGLNKTDIYDATNTEGNFKSYSLNIAPYAPPFYDMLLSKLNELYPGQINFKNLSLGGQTSLWGAANIEARLALWKDANGHQVVPDLIMVGFGVNDAASNLTDEAFKSYMKGIVDKARAVTGNLQMEALYYSPFLPNQLTDTWDINTMLMYENALAELDAADENTGLVKLTSIFAEVIKSKAPEDYISSYWNHGNDFTTRIYATGILTAFLGDEAHMPGDIDSDGCSNLNDLVALAQYVAGWQNIVNSKAMDVNGDAVVDLKDVTHLAQYLAGWDVVLS